VRGIFLALSSALYLLHGHEIVTNSIATERTAEVCELALPAMERTAICEKDGDTESTLLFMTAERSTEENIMVKVLFVL
jgi:hypothetical protein